MATLDQCVISMFAGNLSGQYVLVGKKLFSKKLLRNVQSLTPHQGEKREHLSLVV